MNEERKLQITKKLKKKIFEKYNLNQMEDELLEEAIEHLIIDEVHEEYITIEERVDLTERVFNSIRGLGLLDSIIKDDQITEVMINGPEDIFIEKSGKLYKLEQKFDDERQLELYRSMVLL